MRTEQIHLRVTPELKKAISRRASSLGLNLTEFVLYSAKTADVSKIAQIRHSEEIGELAA